MKTIGKQLSLLSLTNTKNPDFTNIKNIQSLILVNVKGLKKDLFKELFNLKYLTIKDSSLKDINSNYLSLNSIECINIINCESNKELTLVSD